MLASNDWRQSVPFSHSIHWSKVAHLTLCSSIHVTSFSPPPIHCHLPASHHQCSQGDERCGEEGPQGINFSHGWESSSQKTWQPQTAWLKKQRREEERKGGWKGIAGGEEGEFFTWWPWERDFGYWVSFFFLAQSPHVLVENEQIVPSVLSPVSVLLSLKIWVGSGTD